MKFFFAFCLFLSSLFGEEVLPDCSAPSLPLLKGIVLAGDKEDLMSQNGAEGVQILNLDLPGSQESLEKDLSSYLMQPLCKESVLAIKKEIVRFYQNRSRPVVAVFFVGLDDSLGIAQFVVIEAKVGEITVKGNRHFKKSLFLKNVGLQPGEPIHSRALLQDVAWLNKNPFRQVDIVYSPGNDTGETNIELLVHDRRTFRLYTGVDDTGNDITGNNRFFAGVNWGNVFGSDQIFSFQYTFNPSVSRFQAYTASYAFPLPWRHVLTLFGGYSHVKSDYFAVEAPGAMFRNRGYSAQGSLRYDILLPSFYQFLNELFFGYDFKRTNNNLEFGGVLVDSQSVNLGQFILGYNIGYQSKKIASSFEIEGVWSPGEWYPDQTNADYATLRPKAKNYYLYGRASFTFLWRFAKPCIFYSAFRGQASTQNLLPSEEYGVGGYNTVRGYKERAANGDHAFVMNLELRSTPIGFGKVFTKKPWIDEFQILGFFDYGIAFVNRPVLGEPKNTHLLSIGPGLRYKIGSYLTFRGDWGFQLKYFDPYVANGPHQRLNFQLLVSY